MATTVLDDATIVSRPRETAVGRARNKILRFRHSERLMHWAVAGPFLVCYLSALVLVVVYNPDPTRPLRIVVSTIHRVSGVCLIVLPALVLLRARSELDVHLRNMRRAWTWAIQDLKWLAMSGAAALGRDVKLPEQGKFNAGQKLNFMMVQATYPLYVGTGIWIWASHGAFFSWLVHFSMAVIATPLVLGHIYMATINPDSRPGLQGVFSGWVDREWARHHHPRWFRRRFERPASGPAAVPPAPQRTAASRAEPARGGNGVPASPSPARTAPPPGAGPRPVPRPSPGASAARPPAPPGNDTVARIRCGACRKLLRAPSWSGLLDHVVSGATLCCPACNAPLDVISVVSTPEATAGKGLATVLQRLERSTARAGPVTPAG